MELEIAVKATEIMLNSNLSIAESIQKAIETVFVNEVKEKEDINVID